MSLHFAAIYNAGRYLVLINVCLPSSAVETRRNLTIHATFKIISLISAPLVSPGNISLYNTSSTSIKVNWHALEQNSIRGIFYGYEIWFTAHPEFPSAYLRYGIKVIFILLPVQLPLWGKLALIQHANDQPSSKRYFL